MNEISCSDSSKDLSSDQETIPPGNIDGSQDTKKTIEDKIKYIKDVVEDSIKKPKFPKIKPYKDKVSQGIIRAASNLFKGRKVLYDRLVDDGYYLPSFKSRAASIKYLSGIINNISFSIKDYNPYIGNKIKISRKVLLAYLKILISDSQKILQMTDKNPPDKSWLVNILFTIKPNSILFYSESNTNSSVGNIELSEIMKVCGTGSFTGNFSKKKPKYLIELKKYFICFIKKIAFQKSIIHYQNKIKYMDDKIDEIIKNL